MKLWKVYVNKADYMAGAYCLVAGKSDKEARKNARESLAVKRLYKVEMDENYVQRDGYVGWHYEEANC